MKDIYLYPCFKHLMKYSQIWFYSDPHFGDEDMVTIRKNYISDEEQIRRINSKAGRNDVLIVLGDVGDLDAVKKLRASYKILVLGNHDAGHSNYQCKVEESENDDNRLFDEVYTGAVTLNDKLVLSHQPIPDLPPFWFNIHGHDHSNRFTGSRHLNCCAEHIDYTPISLTSIIKDGLLAGIDSIHRLQIDATVARKQKKGN